jgi:hypothetical protein
MASVTCQVAFIHDSTLAELPEHRLRAVSRIYHILRVFSQVFLLKSVPDIETDARAVKIRGN